MLFRKILLRWKLYRYTKDINNFYDKKYRKNWLSKSNNTFSICRRYKKGSYIRNQIAKVFKLVRAENPFEPVDYSEAKKLYNDYFKIDNHITYEDVLNKLLNGEDVYLTMIRDVIGIQLDKSEKYEKSTMYEEIGAVFKAQIMRDENFGDEKTGENITKYEICLNSPCEMEDGNGVEELNNYTFAHYRYSNDDEIKQFNEYVDKYNVLEEEIQTLSTELNKKRYTQNKYIDCVVKQ